MSTRGESGPGGERPHEHTRRNSICSCSHMRTHIEEKTFSFRLLHFTVFHLFSKHIKVCDYSTDTCIWKFLSNKQDILFKQPRPGFKASPEPRRANHGAANQPLEPGEEPHLDVDSRPPEPEDELQGPRPRSGVSALSSLDTPPHPPCRDPVPQPPANALVEAALTAPQGPPWSSPWRLKLEPPHNLSRYISSPNSPSLASASPRLPTWSHLLQASARTSLEQLHPNRPFPAGGSSHPPPNPEPH